MDSLLKWLVCHRSRRRRCHNDVLKYGVQLQLPATNNEAEYEAILASLRVARALGVRNLRLKTNSKLIVRQITNKYEVKEERMKKYLQLTSQLID